MSESGWSSDTFHRKFGFILLKHAYYGNHIEKNHEMHMLYSSFFYPYQITEIYIVLFYQQFKMSGFWNVDKEWWSL